MKSRYHLASAVVIALAGYQSISFLPFLIGAVLVDVDHQIDFYIRHKRFTLSVTELSESLANTKHFFLPLHCVEFFALCTFVAVSMSEPFKSFAFGFVVHFVLDVLSNGYESVRALFLTFRILEWRQDFGKDIFVRSNNTN